MNCPDENTLLAYCARSLGAAESRAVEAHLDACSACLALVGEAARGSEPSTLPDDARPERPDTGRARAQDDAVRRGTVLGRYVVIDRVGSGGMGVVLSAYDPQLDRKVALKLVRSLRGDGAQELEQRLLREAQAVARLSHPQVITVFDVGTVNGRLFMAMEFVEGRTLRQWQKERPRPWQEVLAAYRQAGQGLAAAHAAHLIHRDFKPDNVLVDGQGRVRVTDFGLARLPEGTTALPPDTLPDSMTPSSEPVALTRTGSLMGTPAYMPPEQWKGEPTDARGDQFSFCVALYEALFGIRPFARGQPPDFGRVQSPSPEVRVPAWVRRAVLRGLSVARAERYPSMDALLDALTRDPTRRRAQLALGTGVLTAMAALTVMLVLRGASNPCAGAPERTASVWDEARSAKVQQALLATGSPLAAEAADAVARNLTDYARAWEQGYTQTCQATRVRQEQPESVLALRMACLDSRLESLGVFADVMEHADAPLVEKAAEASQKLPRVSECARVESLLAVVPPPEGPGVAEKLEGARTRLGRARVLLGTGRYAQGLEEARAALAVARELGYRPLEAEALHEQGSLEYELARYEDAQRSFTDAMRAALAGRHDLQALKAATELVFITGFELADEERGLDMAAQARALLERSGPEEELASRLENHLGAVHFGLGLLPQASEHYERSLAIRERLLGPDHLDTARVLTNLAMVRKRQGHPREALRMYEQAIAVQQRQLGPHHPSVASTLIVLADARRALEGLKTTLPLYLQALELRRTALGETHLDTLRLQNDLGRLHEDLGQWDEARRYHEDVLARTGQTHGTEHEEYAQSLEFLARMEERQGHLDAALQGFTRAHALQQRRKGPTHFDTVRMREERAVVLRKLGRTREARAELEAMLALKEAEDGAEHPWLVSSLTELARTYLAMKEPQRARVAAERALAIIRPLGWSPERQGQLQFELARALWDAGTERAQALALADTALAAFTEGGEPTAELAQAVLRWRQGRAPP
ncbi:tetratricopeptide repeat protein [Corallococcus sp. BB11-1]|uniref:tetratricopeptide repeat protein n=1 Tax=Corallococcus sp. BB11-1 TaxID=2996783 RepID=UPI00227197FF|nr:tetratricopeptide repeat protein [Corallococcus sp. BB11-1]MCY1031369.1 tetratricopeptide repeat protein [Corallococcus sp. BB11-1]